MFLCNLLRPLMQVYQVAVNTVDTDRAVVGLAEKIRDVLDLALNAEKLKEENEGVRRTIKTLFNQIIECCFFLIEYSRKSLSGKSILSIFHRSL